MEDDTSDVVFVKRRVPASRKADVVEVVDLSPNDDTACFRGKKRRKLGSGAVAVAAIPTTRDDVVQRVLEMFPEVALSHLQLLMDKYSVYLDYGECLHRVCDELSLTKYPKESRVVADTTSSLTAGSVPGPSHDDPEDISLDFRDNLPRYLVLPYLLNDYPYVSANSIHHSAQRHKFHYAATRRYIDDCLRARQVYRNSQPQSSPSTVPSSKLASTGQLMDPLALIGAGRRPQPNKALEGLQATSESVDALSKEFLYVSNHPHLFLPKGEDKKLSQLLHRGRTQDPLPTDSRWLLECSCCYVEAMIDAMVQCGEGHLFCKQCLHSYVKEATYGEGKASISCMAEGCSATFPNSQLRKALPADLLQRYEEVVQDEVLRMSGLGDVVKCSVCGATSVMGPEDGKVLRCPKPSCQKETCRYCGCDWEEHFGIPCKEMESRNATKFRTTVEEEMTAALVRKCPACGLMFMKESQCNRMTCRCGSTMCYVCRKPHISYDHFCSHPRNPTDSSCKLCTKCSLWENPEPKDKKAISAIQSQANQQLSDQTDEAGEAKQQFVGPPLEL